MSLSIRECQRILGKFAKLTQNHGKSLHHGTLVGASIRRNGLMTRCYSIYPPLRQDERLRKGGDSQGMSVYDKSPDWRDWFQSAEYRNAWTDDIEPLEEDPVLDRQSRFLLDLLNKLYQVGLTKTADRVTTERVHGTLQQLEDLPDQSTQSMWQRAERGRVLLEAMELFEPLRDEPNLPLAPPLPSYETYWRVLRMYGSKYLHGTTALNRDVPLICHEMVQRMQDSRRLELQPTAVHWNQVLIAYANSSDEERPIKAAKLLYELDAKGLTDASSFSHTLRACVSLAARHQRSTAKSEQLALMVAKRVWNGLKQSKSIDILPFHFLHMLRACRNVRDDGERDDMAQQIFNEAIQAQKINIHVLNELLQVATPALLEELLGRVDYPKDPLKLIRQVPSEWMEILDEDGGKSPYEW